MRAFVVLALLAVVVVAVAAADTDSERPRRHRRHHHHRRLGANKPVRRCDKGWTQVGKGLCCPRDHAVLIDGSCYAHCHHDSDDMVLGSWVGCREKCDPGYESRVNTCYNGALQHERKDHTRNRDGVSAKAVRSLSTITNGTVSTCEEGWKKVKGGCCPKHKPQLIAGQCYTGCEAGYDEIVVGDYIACRKPCKEGWTQHRNYCSKDGRNDRERRDYPRYAATPRSRIVVHPPVPEEEPKDTGCGDGYVRASKHYCCPSTEPILKGLLCYEKCKSGFDESGYGCRKPCKEGWSQSVLQCGKGAQAYRREGYERHPKPSKLRL